MKRTWFGVLIFIVWVIHGIINLERTYYINEILSLIGGLLLLSVLSKRARWQEPEVKLIVWIFFYGCASLVAGLILYSDTDAYRFSRTLPIWYSTLCFFVGAKYLSPFLHTRRLDFLRLCLVAPGVWFGGKLSPPIVATIALLEIKTRWIFYALLIAFLVVMTTIKAILLGPDGSSTVIVMILVVLAFALFSRQIIRLLASRVMLGAYLAFAVMALGSLFYVAMENKDFFTVGYEFFDADVDRNSIWRLMFWTKTVKDLSFFEWPFGIGLGAPIFDELDMEGWFITRAEPGATDKPYTLSLHNSFLAWFVRFGIVGLVLLLAFIAKVWRRLALLASQYFYFEKLLLATVLAVVIAMFNVVLESPLYSGFFWCVFGAAYGACKAAEAATQVGVQPRESAAVA